MNVVTGDQIRHASYRMDSSRLRTPRKELQDLILDGKIEELDEVLATEYDDPKSEIEVLRPTFDYGTEEHNLLMTACKYGVEAAVPVLLHYSPDVNLQDSIMKRTALMLACKGGFMKIIDMLLENGAEVNVSDHDHKTPLIMACEGGHLGAALRLLAGAGADPRPADAAGLTALCYAVRRVQLPLVLALAGRELELDDGGGGSPRPTSSSSLPPPPPPAAALGVDDNDTAAAAAAAAAEGPGGGEAAAPGFPFPPAGGGGGGGGGEGGGGGAQKAYRAPLPDEIMNISVRGQARQMLTISPMSSKKGPEARQHRLVLSCLVKAAPEVEALLARRPGAAADGPTVMGLTPLMAACVAGQAGVVEVLAAHGADLGSGLGAGEPPPPADARGRSALMMAAEFGHLECVARLLAAGTLRATQLGGGGGYDTPGTPPAALDRGSGRRRKRRGDAAGTGGGPHVDMERRSPLMLAAANGHEAVADLLLDSGARADGADATGKTALLLAALAGKADLTWLLRTKGHGQLLGDVGTCQSLFLGFEDLDPLAAAELAMADLGADRPFVPEAVFIRALPHLRGWLTAYVVSSPNPVQHGLECAGRLRAARRHFSRLIAWRELTELSDHFSARVERCISAEALGNGRALGAVLGAPEGAAAGAGAGAGHSPVLHGPVATAAKYSLKGFLALPQVAEFVAGFWLGALSGQPSETFFLIQSPTSTPYLTFSLWRTVPLFRTVLETAFVVTCGVLTVLVLFDDYTGETFSTWEVGMTASFAGFCAAELFCLLRLGARDYLRDYWNILRLLPCLPFLAWLPVRYLGRADEDLRGVATLLLSTDLFFLWFYFLPFTYLLDVTGKNGIVLAILKCHQQVLRFTALFAAMTCSFAGMLHTQFEALDEFRTFPHACLTLFMMTSGNYDLSIFDSHDNFKTGYTLCCLFILINGLILPGLLIAILTTAFFKFDKETLQESCLLRVRLLAERTVDGQGKLREALLLPPPLSALNLLLTPFTAGKRAVREAGASWRFAEVVVFVVDLVATTCLVAPALAALDVGWVLLRPGYWGRQARGFRGIEKFFFVVLALGVLRPLTYLGSFLACCVRNELQAAAQARQGRGYAAQEDDEEVPGLRAQGSVDGSSLSGGGGGGGLCGLPPGGPPPLEARRSSRMSDSMRSAMGGGGGSGGGGGGRAGGMAPGALHRATTVHFTALNRQVGDQHGNKKVLESIRRAFAAPLDDATGSAADVKGAAAAAAAAGEELRAFRAEAGRRFEDLARALADLRAELRPPPPPRRAHPPSEEGRRPAASSLKEPTAAATTPSRAVTEMAGSGAIREGGDTSVPLG